MASPTSGYRRALVVDDDDALVRLLTRMLRQAGVEHVEGVHTAQEGVQRLASGFDLLLCDLYLDRESGIFVIEHARKLSTPPVIVAMSGAATRQEVFGLMANGVCAFLEKPFRPAQLTECISRAADAADLLEQIARAQVGRVGAREAQQMVRQTMFREALALTDGNRHAAARLLKVDRRLVQLMANELDATGGDDSSG